MIIHLIRLCLLICKETGNMKNFYFSLYLKVRLYSKILSLTARQFLFQQGLDYRHGTGHGVGAYLEVD